MSARSNSEASSNASSPPSSVHISANSQVINNNNNAPKYGTLVPNRVFVGGIPSNTTEPELCQLFSKYGNVRATKIIADRAGVSKGYGFVTFETEEEAKRLQLDADNITLRERRLNIAPAVKKQPFGRAFDRAASPPPTTPSLYYHNGMPYTFHNGMAYFPQAPNQGAAAVPTPEMPTVFQGSGFGPHSNAQSYGPTMMYPCGANPATTMFISPQPYNPYPHMPVPTQGPPPIMYTGGPNPSANQPANTPENTQSVHITAGPPAPYYLPPTITQTPEMYYNMQAAPSQGCYTPVTVTTLPSHDSMVHFCDVSSIEQNSNNVTPEMQPSFFHMRNYPNHLFPHFSPMHQQAPPALSVIPPPAQLPQTRRFGNGLKKSATNGSSNMHMNTRKMKTEGMDCGAAGDGPVPNVMQVSALSPSPPGTNNKNAASAAATAQDLCSQVRALSL